MELKQENLTVGFVSLGCPKNTVDSERMLAEIAAAGLSLAADADEAGVVVINTCGFIRPAVDEALEAIGRAVSRKKRGPVKKVIVAGCLAERLGRRLFDRAGGIDAVVGLAARDRIAEIISRTIESDRPAAYIGGHAGAASNDKARLLITPGHYAYLRISDGCGRKCSFCTIPSIRGPFRSKPAELVLEEAAELAAAGVRELNVIGQDITAYGRDLGEKEGLSRLLRGLEKIEPVRWIRLLYMNPAGITDRLIETVAGSDKILSYIDMPIQHINDDILKSMRRVETGRSIRTLVEKLRDRLDGCVLRTTVMVGYPGETEKHFRQLLDFVSRARFEALGCFTFWPEEATAAAAMPHQVPERIKRQRRERLMLAQQKIAFEANQKRVGTELVCLLDDPVRRTRRRARFYGQAPEIDGVCLARNCREKSGSFVKAVVTAADGYDLVVRRV
jgi:ribosomal protein S12 methylthiotransferase